MQKLLTSKQRWYQSHKVITKARALQWAARNKLKVLAIQRNNYESKPERGALHCARQRCDNPKNPGYKNYGGRGIRCLLVSADQIIKAIGRRPSKEYSLDRIDNSGHYRVGNIRWATRPQQNFNKRKSYAS